MDTLGERLRYLRKSKNLKREELAAIIGLTPRVITFYETGDRDPSLKVLLALADYFDVSLDYLVGRSDDPRRH
ncbi:helix-turn-helix domain-containing protein [Desulfoscipio geothermicus]|uniref:DNA-binding transcriptional regulator, XRE-family HTH domain n=1 Tax=Desulfoscipio geothermicus DSM 3669 TaxID=1121426 RepID=A0A1I6E428_9FIRM|nr:helix-turn-helix transcriptional regulator [Desulfoscipio geothermicus]SFR12397.1 DNA-binding transcriptional regulator, XRE-family HTH domain [Desulfoscipio geothermicus DSM 3669]